ncbi:MAG TPA: SPOR domain-containing protein [Gemmatimonadaceae bacterium]|nr:SPOR domain-containing protein [Gemmatimonadaceae bacterium]
MFRWGFLAAALIPCAAGLTFAQTAPRPIDPVFARAQALVSDGNGVAGRALVDSVLHATPTNAPLYPQALFWRASLASNAADAESDYKHIVVDYPLAPQAEDALLRLAQLELARGDRDGALAHLQRIPRDYPHSKSLARANYWTARVLFEKNDIPNACAANASALAESGADEIELRNQIQYQGQRCPAVAEAAATVKSAAPPDSAKPVTEGPELKPTTVQPPKVEPAKVEAPKTESHVVEPPKVEAAKKVSDSPSKSVAKSEYSVQVAAYNHKADAEKLVSTLGKRGYSARVDGDTIPFRVRIGRYSTATEAEDALKKIKAKHMDGFVVRAPER